MDRLIKKQRQVISSLSEEIKHVRSKTLTDFELSFSSMKDTLTLKDEMIAKQQKEISYLEMEYIQLMEDCDDSEVRILKCFYPWSFDLFNAMDPTQFLFFRCAAEIKASRCWKDMGKEPSWQKWAGDMAKLDNPNVDRHALSTCPPYGNWKSNYHCC